MKTAVIIPIRGIKKSMTRLRHKLEEDVVNDLVKQLLVNTIESLSNVSYPIYVLTSEKELKHELSNFEVNFSFDNGSGLNEAVSQMVKAHYYERYMLIMPDLPGISENEVEKLLKIQDISPYVIVPTQDHGTACALLPQSVFPKQFFGKKSALKIIEYCDHNQIPLFKLANTKLLIDVDTIEDYDYWYREKE